MRSAALFFRLLLAVQLSRRESLLKPNTDRAAFVMEMASVVIERRTLQNTYLLYCDFVFAFCLSFRTIRVSLVLNIIL